MRRVEGDHIDCRKLKLVGQPDFIEMARTSHQRQPPPDRDFDEQHALKLDRGLANHRISGQQERQVFAIPSAGLMGSPPRH
jgi:hypothetical protein